MWNYTSLNKDIYKGCDQMAPRLLFRGHDIHTVTENQKHHLALAFENFPQEKLDDLASQQALLSRFRIHVPVLLEDQKTASERKTKADVSREWDRMISDRSRPFWVDATEITVHVPFEGDGGLFDIRPTTFSSLIPRGDVVGQELRFIFVVSREGLDIPSLLSNELSNINQHLSWLRASEKTVEDALQRHLAELIAKRKAEMRRHQNVVSSLGIPLRVASPILDKPIQPRVNSRVSPATDVRKPTSWQVFISHASEDKDAIARPLAEALRAEGITVWYDEFTLKVGDSLRASIDHGLASSKYGIVILSKAFFGRHWPEQELNGLAAKEVHGKKTILPVWHDVGHIDVAQFSPMLADRLAAVNTNDLRKLVDQLIQAITA